MLDIQNCHQHHVKNAKATKLFYSQPSALPNDASPAKFYLSTTFGLSFITNSVAPTRSSTFYTYLIIKIGNRNLKLKICKDTRGHLYQQGSYVATDNSLFKSLENCDPRQPFSSQVVIKRRKLPVMDESCTM